MSHSLETTPRKSDWRRNAAVLACLLFGGGLTYWLSGDEAAATPRPGSAVHGRRFDAPPDTRVSVRAAKNASVAPGKSDPDYASVGFDTLAGFYCPIREINPAAARGVPETTQPGLVIPAPIQALSGKKVAVPGYMVPLKQDHGACTMFLLVRDQNICCFRRPPSLNELIKVTMKGKGVRYVQNQLVTVFGTLTVSEQKGEGAIICLYSIEADDMAGPMDL